MRVCLVGGSGFIGHHLAPYLARKHKVSIIDSLEVNNALEQRKFTPTQLNILRQREEILRDFDQVRVDATSPDLLGALFDARPAAVIHLAAVAHAGKSNNDIISAFDNNERSLVRNIQAISHLGIPHLVFFSSSTVYGDWPKLNPDYKKRERDQCHPRGAYAVSKFNSEMWLRDASDRLGFDYTIIRPSALYGERCISGRVVQKFIEAGLAGESLTVGPGKLDFTYIFDLVKGVARILEVPTARKQTYNLTAGNARPIMDVAKIIDEEIGASIFTGKRDLTLPERGTLCIDRAESDLGYKPSYSLEAGVGKYLRWAKDQIT